MLLSLPLLLSALSLSYALPSSSNPSSTGDAAPKGRLGYVVPNTHDPKPMSAAEWSGLRVKARSLRTSSDSNDKVKRHVSVAGANSNHEAPLGAVKMNGLKARAPVEGKKASRRLRRNHSARSPNYHSPRSGTALKPISLPLKSVRSLLDERGDGKVHGLVYLQQHMNRAHRRHAEMRGIRLEEGVLKKRMNERLLSLGIGDDVSKLRKRDVLGDLLKGLGLGSGGGITVGNGQAASPSPADSPTAASSSVAQPAASSSSPSPGSANADSVGAASSNKTAASSANDGFSQLEFEAAVSGKVTKASAVTASQSIGLDIEANDVGYFAELTLGTPGLPFKILMDSGSADFWVPSQVCRSCGDHQQLGSKSSSSFQATRQAFQVTYGTGEVQGALVHDVVKMAGLTLGNHTFGVTTDESEEFSAQGVPFDGLMGLAKSTLSNQGVLTPIEALKKEGLVSAAQVSYKLGRVADGVNDGQITFGGIDKSKFSGSLTLFDNINTQGFWEGSVGATTVDGKDTGLNGKTAILDTGTTLIIMPQKDADAVHNLIPGAKSDGQGGFIIPCTTTSSIAFSFGGTSFAIDPRDLAFQPLTNDLKGDCASGISAGDIGGADQWLIGDVFLKSQVFTTIVDTNQMGLAVANVPA